MSALAGLDDLWSRLVRGLCEAGLPDATRGDGSCRLDGQLNVENLLRPETAAEGIVVEFPGPVGVPVPELVYTVRVVRAGPGFPTGVAVEVRCPETLLHHLWSVEDVQGAAPRLVQHLREHHAAFLDWRRRGGEVRYAERLGIPALPVEPPEPALVRFLAGLYGEGASLADGPARGWWAERGGAAAWAGRIAAGQGQGPLYVLGAAGLDPEDLEHVERLRTVGWWLGVFAVVQAIVAVCSLGFVAWAWYAWPYVPWAWFVQGLAGLGGALAAAAGAQALVRQRNRWFFGGVESTRWLVLASAAVTALPCTGLCCVGGLPLAVFVIMRTLDPRTPRVLATPAAGTARAGAPARLT